MLGEGESAALLSSQVELLKLQAPLVCMAVRTERSHTDQVQLHKGQQVQHSTISGSKRLPHQTGQSYAQGKICGH